MPGESQSKYDQKLVYVLKTSAAIFAEKGYHSTSIRDIARATKMSLSGLYYYFKSKDELLFLIQDYCFSTVIDDCRRLLAGVDDPVHRLKLLIENHLNYFVNNMNEMKVLSHEANSIGGDFLKKVNSKKRQYVDLAMGLLEEVAHKYRVKGVDIRVATFSLFGMMNWIYNWYNPRKDVDVAGLSQNITRIFLSGFLGDKSLEADRLETGRESHLERTVSIWQQ
ncbi:MAG TPA: TetR/AcrR family transcriptional regulator [Blastocatellia bacterium]|jgi:AcrR family transcriptional regulator|nr:TetR/AcrR family transcriptional regulator [Blastocatellia bacterium]